MLLMTHGHVPFSFSTTIANAFAGMIIQRYVMSWTEVMSSDSKATALHEQRG